MTCTSSEAHTGCKTRVQPCTLRPLQQPRLCSCPLCSRLVLLSCFCLHTRDLLQFLGVRIPARSRIIGACCSCAPTWSLQTQRKQLRPDLGATSLGGSSLDCPAQRLCHSISFALGNIPASLVASILLVPSKRQVQVCLPAYACWRPPSLLACRLPDQASCHRAAANCPCLCAQGLLSGLRHIPTTQHGGLLGG